MLTVDEIRKRIIPVLEENNVRGAVLFGSYAKGTANEDSDVDLLLDSDLRGFNFLGLVAKVQDALNMEDADIFNLLYVKEHEKIFNEIIKYGVLIYGKVGHYKWHDNTTLQNNKEGENKVCINPVRT